MSSANGDGPIDTHPPLRDIEQIAFCHDMLKIIIHDEMPLFLFSAMDQSAQDEMLAASNVLCWVLQDGNEGAFGQEMQELEETLSDLGYTWERTGN